MMLITHLTHLIKIINAFTKHVKKLSVTANDANTHNCRNNNKNMQKKIITNSMLFFLKRSHNSHKSHVKSHDFNHK